MPQEVRDTIRAMAVQGLSTSSSLFQRQPEIPVWAADIYETFYLVDRDGFSGALKFSGMLVALDWLEVSEKRDQRRIMSIWRQMEAARRKTHDKLQEDKGSGASGTGDPGRTG